MGCSRPTNPDGSYMLPSNPRDIGELSNENGFRDRVYTMCYDAPGHGLALNSGYRDPGRQDDIRVERVGKKNSCNPKVKAHPATAVAPVWNPKTQKWEGGSNHCKRKAADLMGPALAWAGANCHRYGLFLAVSTEDWHFEDTAYAPTVRILRYPGPTYDGQPAKQQNQPAQQPKDDSMSAADVEALKTYIDRKGNDIIAWVTSVDNSNRDAPMAVADEYGKVWSISPMGRFIMDAQTQDILRDQLMWDVGGKPFPVMLDRIDGIPVIGQTSRG